MQRAPVASRLDFGMTDHGPTSHDPTAGAMPTPQLGADDHEDVELVHRIREQSGASRAAWERLVVKYQHRLFAVCLRMVNRPDAAKDLVQDSFVKIIQGIESYDGRSKLSTWMIRVTMNVCLTHARSSKLRSHKSLDAAIGASETGGRAGASPENVRSSSGRELSEVGELSPRQRVEHNEQVRQVTLALARLDPEQRAILVLRDVQGLDYDQIAQVMSIPGGTVKSRIFRARAALREELETENRDAE